jgi:DNA-binding beta-propeller fold protein YncE
VAMGAAPYNVVISPNGKSAYAGNRDSNTISQYSRNTETGQLKALSPATAATGSSPHIVAVSPDGASVYVSDNGSNAVSQFSRNTETGELTALSPATVAAGISPYGIAVSPDGRSAYVANGSDSVSQYSRESTNRKPTVVTTAASEVTRTSARLNATVNPSNSEVSECRFEWDRPLTVKRACTPSPGREARSRCRRRSRADRRYHLPLRISATNTGGTSKAPDRNAQTRRL